MTEKKRKLCSACSADAPKATRIDVKQFKKEHPAWRQLEDDGVDKVRRKFSFAAYRDAIRFTDEVAELADFEDHHPTIFLEWGAVTVTWWTHKIGGVHINDLILARECDRIYDADAPKD